MYQGVCAAHLMFMRFFVRFLLFQTISSLLEEKEKALKPLGFKAFRLVRPTGFEPA